VRYFVFARSRHISLICTGIAVLVLSASGGGALAQGGFLGALFNMLGGQPRASAPPSGPTPSMPNLFDPWGMPLNATVPPSTAGPSVAYCVRTCDGRYFPLPKNAGGANSTPAKVCSSMCPTAETKIYNGNNIESATSSDGKRYSNLPNAFVYRERLVSSCTCNGKDPGGIAAIEIKNDPTLRPGDIVMTANGPVAFKGSNGTNHRLSDFVPAANSTKLSATTKSKVAGMKAMPPKQTGTTVASQKPAGVKPNTATVFTFAPGSTGPTTMSFTTP